eukprot:4564565-Lingulodinium_polyedra.AAC.1
MIKIVVAAQSMDLSLSVEFTGWASFRRPGVRPVLCLGPGSLRAGRAAGGRAACLPGGRPPAGLD